MPSEVEQRRYKNTIFTLVSLLLSVYGTLGYLIFGHRQLNENDPFDVGQTPFTGNIFVIFVYWALLYTFQVLFVLQYLVPNRETRSGVANAVGNHFVIFNVLTFFWSMLFGKGHYFWSELIVIANFFNLLTLSLTHETYALKGVDYLLVHVPTTAIPFSWVLYLLFWNGAALFRAGSGLAARILANIFIWNFLFVPLLFVVFYKDWAVGLSLSVLMFGLGLGQLLTKVFALQWIFAFVIAALLLVFSGVSALGYGVASEEQAPLLGEA